MPVPGRSYSHDPRARSHRPSRQSEAVHYRSCLRIEFAYACAYCLSLEAEIAALAQFGLFEVEHFKPEAKFGHLRTIYKNLMWSCRACNRAKSSKWPTRAEVRRGERFVDPTAEGLGQHLRIVGDQLEALTPAGDYMIDELNLNSLEHCTRRRERDERFKLWQALQSALASGAVRDAGEKATLEAEAATILEMIVGTHKPWDAAITCAC